MTNPGENLFAKQQAQHSLLVSEKTVKRSDLLKSLGDLESVGNSELGAKRVGVATVASAMLDAYQGVETLNVRPPLNADQLRTIAGKVATLEALTGQVSADSTPAVPTDTSNAKTSGSKA